MKNKVPTFTSNVTTGLNIADTDITRVWYGTADFGATRWVTGANASALYVHNTSGTIQTNQGWNLVDASVNGRGLWWDGTRFREPANGSAAVWIYSTFLAASALFTKFWMAFTWYDSAGTVHESALSPRSTLTLLNRRRMSITWPTIPVGGADEPNSVRIYMKANATDPGSAFASYFRQGTTYTGVQTYLEAYSTATAGSAAAAFTSGTGAEITSSDGSLHIRGDGMVRWRAPVVVATCATDQLLAVGVAEMVTDFDVHSLEVIPPGTSAGDIHNAASNPSRFKVPTGWGGVWEAHAEIIFTAGADAQGRMLVQLRKNAAGVINSGTLLKQAFAQGSDAIDSCHLRWIGALNAGDYVEVQIDSSVTDRDMNGGAGLTQMIWRYHGEA